MPCRFHLPPCPRVGMLYCWLVLFRARFPRLGEASRWWWRFGQLWGSRARRVAASPVGRAASGARTSDTGGGLGRLPGPADRGVSAGTVACAGSGSWPGPGLGAGQLENDGSVGRTAGRAGGVWCRWDTGSVCAGACRWSPGAAVLCVAGAWGLRLSVGLWVWGCTVPEGRGLVLSVGVAVRVCVEGPSDGAYAGPSLCRSGVPWLGRGSGWACVAAARLAAGWQPRVDAPGGACGCGAGLPVGPEAGPMCGCAVPGGCSSWVPTAAVFVGLGTALHPAGDARCPWIPVAAWRCGWYRCAARLDARSCRGVCGMPALDGFGTSVVRVASAAWCRCGEVTGAWGVKVDGMDDVEAVGPCGKPTPNGARACTFVALVAAVARDRGGRVVMVAVLGEEEEELWCRAPPADILATAALPYGPWPRRWDVRLLGAPYQLCEAAGEGHAPPSKIGGHQPLGRLLGQKPAALEEISRFAAMGAADDPHCPFCVPHQPAKGEREAGSGGDDGGAVVVEVHGGDRAPTVSQIASGG